jgi:DNA-binding CsgD family transcriptional regulator
MTTELTTAETTALAYLAEGYTLEEAAKALWKSRDTIKSQVASARMRLEARNVTHAVTLALRSGILATVEVPPIGG